MGEPGNAQAEIAREIIRGIERLHLVGGLGLVMIGGAVVVFILAAISPVVADAAGSVPRVYEFTLVIAIIGAIFGAGERYFQYRLRARGLDMMATITERLVQSATPDSHRLNPNEVGELVQTIFKSVWMPSGQASEADGPRA